MPSLAWWFPLGSSALSCSLFTWSWPCGLMFYVTRGLPGVAVTEDIVNSQCHRGPCSVGLGSRGRDWAHPAPSLGTVPARAMPCLCPLSQSPAMPQQVGQSLPEPAEHVALHLKITWLSPTSSKSTPARAINSLVCADRDCCGEGARPWGIQGWDVGDPLWDSTRVSPRWSATPDLR